MFKYLYQLTIPSKILVTKKHYQTIVKNDHWLTACESAGAGTPAPTLPAGRQAGRQALGKASGDLRRNKDSAFPRQNEQETNSVPKTYTNLNFACMYCKDLLS